VAAYQQDAMGRRALVAAAALSGRSTSGISDTLADVSLAPVPAGSSEEPPQAAQQQHPPQQAGGMWGPPTRPRSRQIPQAEMPPGPAANPAGPCPRGDENV
jgi:hypothetical protein